MAFPYFGGIILPMTTNRCPACAQSIATDDINVKDGVAHCRSCGKLSRLADLIDQPSVDPKVLETPPAGCSYDQAIDGGAVVRASLRSPGVAVGLLAFCLFWNGIVSTFLLTAIGGLYTNLIGPLPQWFPVWMNSGKRGQLGPNMHLGETLFLCIFLIPFVVVGLGMFLAFLIRVIGRVEMIILGNEGKVRTGFGPFNWTCRFDASQVKRVTVGRTSYEQNGQFKPLISIEADRTVKFGSMLPDDRRAWMLSAAQLLLVSRKSVGSPSRFAGRRT